MLVDARVAERMRRGSVLLRITGEPPQLLLSHCINARRDLVDRWNADPPHIAANGVWLSNPVTGLAIVPPAVILSVTEIQDSDFAGGRFTYDRLIDALGRWLPEQATVEPVDPIRPPAAQHLDGTFLELRIAVEAVLLGVEWDVSPAVGERIDDLASDWLLSVGSDVVVEFGLPAGGDLAIRPDQVRETLRAQRQFGGSCTITAISGRQVRTLVHHYRSAHLSLIAGVRSGEEPFDYRPALDILTQALYQLAPDVRSAFIRYTSDPGQSCAYAHSHRQLFKIANRRHVQIEGERTLEEAGLTDAQGVAFLPSQPAALPPDWSHKPFAQLHRIQAPDLDAWLAQPPTPETLRTGRAALSTLLQQTLGAGPYPQSPPA